MSATLVGALPQLEEQLAEAKIEARITQERVEALEQVIGGIRRLNGRAGNISLDSDKRPPLFAVDNGQLEDGPRGREAVRIITRERPGIWPLKDLAAEMVRRGWAKNSKSVEVAVHRLANNGECRRVGIGVYEFPDPATEDGGSP